MTSRSNTARAKTPPDGAQRIIPYLTYQDAPAAIEFLCKAFGFEAGRRYMMDDGRVGHAELHYQGDQLMLASSFEGFGKSPLQLPDVHCQIFMYVDDVDAHFARARQAGATIVSEPTEEHGMRRYRVTDPEGHRFSFATVLDDAGEA